MRRQLQAEGGPRRSRWLLLKAPEFQTRALSTEWFFEFSTETGTQSANGTDGKVHASTWFRSDLSVAVRADLDLNNEGDDREGGWDHYLFRVRPSEKVVAWVSIKQLRIELKGTDAWFVKHVQAQMWPHMQSIPATEGSFMTVDVNEWLDNNNAERWDRWRSHSAVNGKLHF